MGNLIDISSYPVVGVLDVLLQDKSTQKNIIWATDTYEMIGESFTDKTELKAKALLWQKGLILPRIQKSQEDQIQRTRKKAEVFTPAWLCNKMNNHCDEDWFGRSNVFNVEHEDHTWTAMEDSIVFPKGKTWRHYVDARRLEITCGEAPYLVSRYDVSTGAMIVQLRQRIGILDRKLRIVNENTTTYEEWLQWVIRAFESSYGYEYQGDNVLIARINLLLTFIDYYEDRWARKPDDKLLQLMANKIAWNIWQMDGLKDTVPLGKPYEAIKQITVFDFFEDRQDSREDEPQALPCKVFNWRSKNSLRFMALKERHAMGKKLFNYVIGNPPYQEDFENSGDNGNFGKPVYNYFLDATYDVAEKVELIHPARFLFNAGSTPKAWNKKMLEDEHLKVLLYEPNSKNVFSNTDIKGGVAITYRDEARKFGAIGEFVPFDELRDIILKVSSLKETASFSDIVFSRTAYRLTDLMHEAHPEALNMLSKGHPYDMSTNIFQRLPQIFFEEKPDDGQEYIGIYGLEKTKRALKYIKKTFVNEVKNLGVFKVLVPAANGSGALGEVLSTPLIGHTESFISIGCFETESEAENCLKYIKSKFARCLLGVLKVTQHNPPEKWKYVPLQDFSPSSDIDWSQSVHDIDLQLYRKYGLNEVEIEFIETHVKEMA